jgi:uncharacterized protein
MYERAEMNEEELLEDLECLAGLTIDHDNPPVVDGRSVCYTYDYPEQETKLKTGDSCVYVTTRASLGELQIDEEPRRVRFRYSAKKGTAS